MEEAALQKERELDQCKVCMYPRYVSCVYADLYLWCQACVLLIYDDSACVLCDYAHVYFTFYVIILIILMNEVNIFRREKYAKSYN